MRRARILLGLLLLATLWLGHAARSAGDGEFKIIVHPRNSVTTLERQFLREAFLKTSVTWKGGSVIRPIHLDQKFPVHERFSREVLLKAPAHLRNYWSQRIFSGTGVPPPEADSIEAAVAYVASHPGALGYLPMDADPGSAKVVEIAE